MDTPSFKNLKKGDVVRIANHYVGIVAQKPVCLNYQWKVRLKHAFTLTNDKDSLLTDHLVEVGGRAGLEIVEHTHWTFEHLMGLLKKAELQDHSQETVKKAAGLKEQRFAGIQKTEDLELKEPEKVDSEADEMEGKSNPSFPIGGTVFAKDQIDRLLAHSQRPPSAGQIIDSFIARIKRCPDFQDGFELEIDLVGNHSCFNIKAGHHESDKEA